MTPESLHQSTPQALERLAFVLVEPCQPGNVGAAARAMRAMGFRDLVLVAPQVPDVLAHPQTLAFASGANDLLARARIVSTLEAAIADATLVVGVSADPREFGPPPLTPEAAAASAMAELAADPAHRVALVFGTERIGLSVEQVQRCQLLCSIPGDPDHHSLNLAQAVQILAYVLRRCAQEQQPLDAPAHGPARTVQSGRRFASQAAIEGFFVHLERALVVIGFLDPAHPKKLMPRLRRLFSRSRLEIEEVDLLRGVCKMAEQAGRENPPAWRRGDAGRAQEPLAQSSSRSPRAAQAADGRAAASAPPSASASASASAPNTGQPDDPGPATRQPTTRVPR
jgi:tRNA/rRNA methyltransferase